MAFYKAFFERVNFGFKPAIKQTAEVIFETDIPYENESLDEFCDVMWKAVWEQNPHWHDPYSPIKNTTGWSSVLGGHDIQRIEKIKDGSKPQPSQKKKVELMAFHQKVLDRLKKFTLGCRDDMHEPDEQNISAVVSGYTLDNAMGDEPHQNSGEFSIGLTKDKGESYEWFNLATLIALARKARPRF